MANEHQLKQTRGKLEQSKKYELLTNDTIELGGGVTLFRIRALISFGNVKKGELGGYVENEGNLCHSGNAWVYDNARVTGDAKVYGDAKVTDDAEVYGKAKVFDNTRVSSNAEVTDYAWVYGNAQRLVRSIDFLT